MVRVANRQHKRDALSFDSDIGHIVDEQDNRSFFPESGKIKQDAIQYRQFSGSTSSDRSTGSLLDDCETGRIGNYAWEKASPSLIVPTDVDSILADDPGCMESDSSKLKRSQVNLRLDQCEAVCSRYKKKLILNDMNLCHSDIPLKELCGTALGNSLHKLSLAGNRLGSVPAKLVVSLPMLKTLDLSLCELHQLPAQFNLPMLTRLNLSHNHFSEFPEEVSGARCDY